MTKKRAPRKRESSGLRWGEGSITVLRRASGDVYLARWYDDDGLTVGRHAKSFRTREDAEDHLRHVHRSKAQGTYRSPSDMTVSDLVSEYIQRAASRISDRTVRTYRDRAVTMIDPTIGKRKLDSIKPLDVQRWIDRLVAEKWAASTVRAAVAVLMGALREAAILGITDRHLGQGIRRPAIGRQATATWSIAEARRVMQHVKDDPIFGALYWVAIATGMRPGELRALSWDQVNLDAGTISVERTITRGPDGSERIANRTKGKLARTIAISPAIVNRLRWHRQRQRERQLLIGGEWFPLRLCFDRGDGHWMYQSTWQRRHLIICREAEVAIIRCHDIRHTSASLELEAGTHPKIVSERLGHTQIAMTMDRYSHVSPSLQRSAANALSDRLIDQDDSAETG